MSHLNDAAEKHILSTIRERLSSWPTDLEFFEAWMKDQSEYFDSLRAEIDELKRQLSDPIDPEVRRTCDALQEIVRPLPESISRALDDIEVAQEVINDVDQIDQVVDQMVEAAITSFETRETFNPEDLTVTTDGIIRYTGGVWPEMTKIQQGSTAEEMLAVCGWSRTLMEWMREPGREFASVNQIADASGLPVGTVDTRLGRFTKRGLLEWIDPSNGRNAKLRIPRPVVANACIELMSDPGPHITRPKTQIKPGRPRGVFGTTVRGRILNVLDNSDQPLHYLEIATRLEVEPTDAFRNNIYKMARAGAHIEKLGDGKFRSLRRPVKSTVDYSNAGESPQMIKYIVRDLVEYKSLSAIAAQDQREEAAVSAIAQRFAPEIQWVRNLRSPIAKDAWYDNFQKDLEEYGTTVRERKGEGFGTPELDEKRRARV